MILFLPTIVRLGHARIGGTKEMARDMARETHRRPKIRATLAARNTASTPACTLVPSRSAPFDFRSSKLLGEALATLA